MTHAVPTLRSSVLGTLAAPAGIDWICVSPKADAPVVQTSGQELKLVFPQALATPDRFEHLPFERFWLQPMDGPDRAANTAAAIRSDEHTSELQSLMRIS